MLKSGFFDSRGGDRRYTSQDMAYIFQLLMTNGVYANPATSLQVVAGTNMTVNVSTGFGVINGRYAYNTADYYITLANASGTYARIDRIVLRMNMTDRVMQLIALTGTPASAPVAPDIVRDGTYYDLSLATITVARGTTVITQDKITDTRNNVAVCGYITGAVDQIDTTSLFAQYETEWELLRSVVAQDSEAIMEVLNDIDYIKTVGGAAPDSNKNVALGLANVYSETLIYSGTLVNSSYATLTQTWLNFNYLRIVLNPANGSRNLFVFVSEIEQNQALAYIKYASTSYEPREACFSFLTHQSTKDGFRMTITGTTNLESFPVKIYGLR